VYEGYGLSETSPIVTANYPGTRKIGSVGMPIPGVEVKLDVAESASTDDGEIVVYGHCVMQGYHNLPDQNAAVFTEDGGFRTGDLGRIDSDGFVFIVGRVKEQYKLANGKYVVPTVIEEKIGLSPYVASVMVYGHNRPFNVALVALDSDAVNGWASENEVHLDEGEMVNNPDVLALIGKEIARLSEGLPKYEHIREFALLSEDFSIENGMLTPTLKVKRRIVLDQFNDTLQGLYQ
jgi:long-chain acyl-CoA synthetase